MITDLEIEHEVLTDDEAMECRLELARKVLPPWGGRKRRRSTEPKLIADRLLAYWTGT